MEIPKLKLILLPCISNKVLLFATLDNLLIDKRYTRSLLTILRISFNSKTKTLVTLPSLKLNYLSRLYATQTDIPHIYIYTQG